MKALVGAFNLEKALVGAFFVIVKSSQTFVKPMFQALLAVSPCLLRTCRYLATVTRDLVTAASLMKCVIHKDYKQFKE